MVSSGSLDVCSYLEAVLFETGVQREEESVGIQSSIVLMDQ